ASFDYTVTDGIAGSNTVTATFNVTNVNDAPVATGETIRSEERRVGEEVSLASTLLANDTDADNLTGAANAGLSIGSVSGAVGGTVSLDSNGNVVFTPTQNYYGPASFDYTVTDGIAGSNTVTATFNVTNVNDAPVATGETI